MSFAADPEAIHAVDSPAAGEQTAGEQTASVAEVHQRARKGIKLMMLRQVGLQIFTFLGGVIIARKLGPGAYGLFGIASYLVGLLAQFGDFGLAASFIQRKAELTDRDLRVGFTLQQMLLAVIVAIILAAAPWLARLYPQAPPDTVWFVRSLAFSLFLTSWRTMSALQLERNLRYEKLAWIEFFEIVIYQSVAVMLALLDKGTWSYVIATLVTGVFGTVMVYRACPWKVRFEYDGAIAREILRFGIPFQFQSLVNQMGDWVVPIFVGSRLGQTAVGLLIWSSANGKKPLVLIDNVTRVAFPHFSRIQDDRAEVERVASRYLNWMLAFGALWFCLLLVAGPAIVQVIYAGKWVNGATTLALYSLMMSFDIISFVMSVALNGMGKVNFLARIALIRSILYMVASVPAVMLIGFNGVPAALLLAQAIMMPQVFRGLGPGSLRRIVAPIAWVLAPVAVSAGIGLLVRERLMPMLHRALLPAFAHAVGQDGALHIGERALNLAAGLDSCVLVALVLGLFAATTWLSAPLWVRNGLQARLGILKQRFAR